MLKAFRGARGGMNPGTMFLIGAAALLLAVGVWYFSKARVEEKKLEHIGEIGRVSTFQLEREAGINLPFADQAHAGTGSPDTLIEIPIEWKEPKTTDAKLAERYDAIEKKLTRNGEIYDQTITLRIDRDLPYRALYQVFAIGVPRGFMKYQIACYPGGESREVRYLDLQPPPPEAQLGKNQLLFRVVPEIGQVRYVLGTSRTVEFTTLKGVADAMKKMTKDDSKFLVLATNLDTPVQNVVEAINAGTYGGFKTITLNRMKVD